MNKNEITIRKSKASDFNNTMKVEKLAFGYDKEAKLVVELLSDETAEPMLSLLAFHNEEAVGHILFTRAYFDGQEESPLMHILAPLAVIPTYQRQGIGKELLKMMTEHYKGYLGIGLIAEKGKVNFYEHCGFKEEKTQTPLFLISPYDSTPC